MRQLLLFGMLAGLAAVLIWKISSVSGEDVDLGLNTGEIESTSQKGIAEVTQQRMETCLNNSFDGGSFSDAVALIQSDYNSAETPSEKLKIEAKKESFVAEMGVKLHNEYKQWRTSSNTSAARRWHQKISAYLDHASNQTTLIEARRLCSKIIWVIDSTRSSEAMDERRRLLSSEYNEGEIAAFLAKVEAISNAVPAKQELGEFTRESEVLFNEFQEFDDKWSRAFGRYVSTGGKDPADWIRSPWRYLKEVEIRRYPWYTNAWIDEFGEIDLKY